MEELLGGVCQFFSLAGIDALDCASPAGVTPVADFGEYYCIAVKHDQIELAAPTQPVLGQQTQPICFEVGAGKGFGRLPASTSVGQESLSFSCWTWPSRNSAQGSWRSTRRAGLRLKRPDSPSTWDSGRAFN